MSKSKTAFTWVLAVALGLVGSKLYQVFVVGSRMTLEDRVAGYEETWKKSLNDVAQNPAPRADDVLANAPRWQRHALKPELAKVDARYRSAYESKTIQIVLDSYEETWKKALNDVAKSPPPKADNILALSPDWQRQGLKPKLAETDARFRDAYERKATQIINDNWLRKFRGAWEDSIKEGADSPSVEAFEKEANLHPELSARLKKELTVFNGNMQKRHPRIRLAIDSFSGYCVFRSREFHAKLAPLGIKLHLVDDDADYKKRIKTLQSGDTPLAVFTVDALINNSALLDNPPATVVMVIDETRGADAMVGDVRTFPNLAAINRADIKVVLVPDSPSDTLARVVRSKFSLPLVPNDWVVEAKNPDDVIKKFRETQPGDPRTFVLWEPHVSKLLKENPNARVLIDSKSFRGYIVDVLVVNRQYLQKNHEKVKQIVKAYLEAAALHQKSQEDMVKLVVDDSQKLVKAKKLAEPLTEEESAKIVQGIWWKTTKENYAHFGLPQETKELCLSMEEMIKNINAVLINTGAISQKVKPELLYDKSICAQLKEERFDAGDSNVTAARASGARKPVASLQVKPIDFLKGSSDLAPLSIPNLEELAATLKTLPQCFLEIRGHALKNTPADKQLATERAQAVAKWLQEKGGVSADRLRAQAAEAPRAGVTFVVLEADR